MHHQASFRRALLCAMLLLGSTAVPAAVTYSGEQHHAASSFGSNSARSGEQRRDGQAGRMRSERHLRHPLQTSPNGARDYDRGRSKDDFRDGYRDGFRDGYRRNDGYRRDDGYYSPDDRRPYGYDGRRPGYGYDYPQRRGGTVPYGYSPYRGGAPGYMAPPVYRYPSVPQPLSPYRR